MNAALKASLWTVLALFLGLNVAMSLIMDTGVVQTVLSALVGACALGAVIGLAVLRRGD